MLGSHLVSIEGYGVVPSVFIYSVTTRSEGTGERACDTSVYLFLFPLNHMTGYTLKEN